MPVEQGEDARHGDRAELPARERGDVAVGHAEPHGDSASKSNVRQTESRGGLRRRGRRRHASSATRTPSIWVASGMLGCGERLPATSSGKAREMEKAGRQPLVAVAMQGRVHRRVAEVGAGRVGEIAGDPGGAPRLDDLPRRQRREVGVRAVRLDRLVDRRVAVVVGVGEVEDVDGDALDGQPRAAGCDAEEQHEIAGSVSSSAARTAPGVYAAETGRTRPATSLAADRRAGERRDDRFARVPARRSRTARSR